MARPTSYTQAKADLICETIASSTRGLEAVCEENEELPTARTVYRWLDLYPEFCQAFVRARMRQADYLFDQCGEIADNNLDDFVWRNGKGDAPGWWEFRGEHVARAKLKIETRLKMAGHLNAAKYGDKLKLEHSGSIEVRVSKLTDEELLEQIHQLIATGHLPLPKHEPVALESAQEPDDDVSDLL